MNGADQRPGNHHFLPAFAKSETFLRTMKAIRKLIGVRRGILRQLPSEIILRAIAKTSSSMRKSALEFIELFTSK